MNDIEKLYFLSRYCISEEKAHSAKCKIQNLADKYPINTVELCGYLSEITRTIWGFKSFNCDTQNGRECGIIIRTILGKKQFRLNLPEEKVANGKFARFNWSRFLLKEKNCPLVLKKAIIYGMNKKLTAEKSKKLDKKSVKNDENKNIKK